MQETRRSRWETYLQSAAPEPERGGYRYPTTDADVDGALQLQDAGKVDREQAILARAADFDWEIALDFGCGLGAKFACFDQPYGGGRLLIGLDADHGRAAEATGRAQGLQHVDLVVAAGSAELLQKRPAGLTVDLIAAIQVLGHVRSTDARTIIRSFADVLTPQGRCLLAVPVVSAVLGNRPASESWDGQGDWHHYVHLDRQPNSAGYRKTVSKHEFDRLQTSDSVLPVRSFGVPSFPKVNRADLPQPLPVPVTLESLLPEELRVIASQLYSIHMYEEATGEAVIGDAIIELRKVA